MYKAAGNQVALMKRKVSCWGRAHIRVWKTRQGLMYIHYVKCVVMPAGPGSAACKTPFSRHPFCGISTLGWPLAREFLPLFSFFLPSTMAHWDYPLSPDMLELNSGWYSIIHSLMSLTCLDIPLGDTDTFLGDFPPTMWSEPVIGIEPFDYNPGM